MKTSKRILSIFLALAMALGLMVLTSAAPISGGYTLYLHSADLIGNSFLSGAMGDGTFYEGKPDLVNGLIGGILGGLNIGSWNAGSFFGSNVNTSPEATVSISGSGSSKVYTVNMNGFSFTTTAETAMHVPNNTVFALTGTSSVTSTYNSTSACTGLVSGGSISVSGTGTLNITSGAVTVNASTGVLLANGGLTVSGNAKVNVTGNPAAVNSYGILGNLTINGGEFTAIGKNGAIYPAYTVPRGYKYYVNTTTTPSTTELISDGTAVIGTAYQYAKIVYALPVAPTVTTTSLPGGAVGSAYSQTLAADGTPAITWTVDSGSLPDGLNLSAAGVISGTPTTAGTFNFTVKAANLDGGNTKALSIVVAPPIVPPAVTTTSLPGGNIGAAYNQTLAATGDPTITWDIAGGSLPGGLNLSAAGVISGTPTAMGTFNFTVKATNGGGSATKALSIVVGSTPVVPVITIATELGGTVGVPYNQGYALTATGTAPITWSIISGALPDGLTLSAAGVISGTPTVAGTFNCTVKASNSAGDGTKALSIVIVEPPAVVKKYVGLFGYNTRYLSDFWNWFKFIFLFGWIWMWF